MANVFDYLKWRGDLTFSQDPPNAVDALIFSGLSYIRFGRETVQEAETPVSLQTAAEVFFLRRDMKPGAGFRRIWICCGRLPEPAVSAGHGCAGTGIC